MSGPITPSFSPAVRLDMSSAISVIPLIHRGPDGYIAFSRKEPDGDFIPLCSLEMCNLEQHGDTLAGHLGQDAYFSVNSFYRAGWGTSPITNLPFPQRQEQHLRYLNACYVDLDFGRDDGLTPEEAISQVSTLIAQERIPPMSLCAYSGRGAYVFWLLCDETNRDLPARGWSNLVDLYKRVNQTLAIRLSSLHPDYGACDAARVLRVPGTRHSKSGNIATYFASTGGQSQPPTYTLTELGEFLSVDHLHTKQEWSDEDEAPRPFDEPHLRPRRTPAPIREPITLPVQGRLFAREEYTRPTKKPGSVPNRVNGARKLNSNYMNDLLALEKKRGGWHKGTRRKRLWLYASFLRGAGNDWAHTTLAVKEMAARCCPPFPSDGNDGTVQSIVKEVFAEAIRKYTRQTLVEVLEVSSEEACLLNLCSIVPEDVHLEREQIKHRPSKKEQVHERREFIREYVQVHGPVSVRVMHEVLLSSGFSVSRGTVGQDMEHLFPLPSERVRAGRPRSVQQELEL